MTNCLEAAKDKLQQANNCLDTLENYEESMVNGLSKLIRRIHAEIKFLNRVIEKESEFKKEHVECSNIVQLSAIVDTLKSSKKVTGVLQTFSSEEDKNITVDIVSDEGHTWTKVIMRKPEALHHLFICGERGNAKPLTMVAEDFIQCATHNPYMFKPPKITFLFLKGVSEALAISLESRGIHISGKRIKMNSSHLDPDFEDLDCDVDKTFFVKVPKTEPELDPDNFIIVKRPKPEYDQKCLDQRVNLDVTAMVAYVTSTANGACNYIFQDIFLTNQAIWERSQPVKPTLDEYFRDHVLFACEDAVNHFLEIVETIGGEGEKARAKQLVDRILVVKNIDTFKDVLPIKGRIKKVARNIFGTGEALQAVTITANRGFVRSAKNKGIKLAVKYHGPRGLTEAKEIDAIPIEVD